MSVHAPKSEKRLWAFLLGAVGLGLVVGIVGGKAVDTTPLNFDNAVADELPDRQPVESYSRQDNGNPPNHYAMETPDGVVEVWQLAMNGRFRDRRRYHTPYQDDYDAYLAEEDAYRNGDGYEGDYNADDYYGDEYYPDESARHGWDDRRYGSSDPEYEGEDPAADPLMDDWSGPDDADLAPEAAAIGVRSANASASDDPTGPDATGTAPRYGTVDGSGNGAASPSTEPRQARRGDEPTSGGPKMIEFASASD